MKKNEIVNLNLDEIAQVIAHELMYEWNPETETVETAKRVDIDSLDKDCYLAVADIKNDIFDKASKIIEEKNIELN